MIDSPFDPEDIRAELARRRIDAAALRERLTMANQAVARARAESADLWKRIAKLQAKVLEMDEYKIRDFAYSWVISAEKRDGTFDVVLDVQGELYRGSGESLAAAARSAAAFLWR